MNQGIFWWAGRPGANGTRRLFQLTRDYLQNVKGLTNLIWVWDVQDFSTLASDLITYNPGSNYWDVLALDMYYSDGQGYTTTKYNAIVNAAGSKPVAIGECEVLPSASLLALQPRWSFFMGWAELVFNQNSVPNLQTLYTASNVVTRDELPGWNTLPIATNLAYNRPVTASTTEDSTHTAAKAVDANGNTRWSSAYADNQHLTVDLGAVYTVNRVRLAWETAYARNYQVQVSTDNLSWNTVQNVAGKTSAAADDYAGFTTPARYVRVHCLTRATAYGFSLFELEVYGTAILSAIQPQRPVTSVFPNPATDQVFLQLPAYWESGTILRVKDIYGRILYKGSVQGTSQSFTVSAFPAGMYYIGCC
jgi:hypothetical protein